jgi:ketosteroid isomerase-like protein
MSAAADLVAEMYSLAKKGKNRDLRKLFADDATWEPARKGDKKPKWNRCKNPDEIVTTLLFRARQANHMRPGQMLELGSYVVFKLRGRRLERLGARGFWIPKLFQVVEVKGGKITRIRDFGTLAEALAGTGGTDV